VPVAGIAPSDYRSKALPADLQIILHVFDSGRAPRKFPSTLAIPEAHDPAAERDITILDGHRDVLLCRITAPFQRRLDIILDATGGRCGLEANVLGQAGDAPPAAQRRWKLKSTTPERVTRPFSTMTLIASLGR